MSTPAVSQLLSKTKSGSISVYTACPLELEFKAKKQADKAEYCVNINFLFFTYCFTSCFTTALPLSNLTKIL